MYFRQSISDAWIAPFGDPSSGLETAYFGGKDVTLVGGLGNDTMSGGTGNQVIADSFDTITGSGDDVFYGENGNDTLIGNDGNDRLYGGNDNDSLIGGTGNDFLYGDSGNDALYGETGDDQLFGGEGNDILDGTDTGADTLTGGAGDDLYVVDGGETLVEAVDEGLDTVRASVSHTLASNIEVLELTGTGDIDGTGNAGDNRIVGNGGVNQLSGGGGGDDTLVGGAGSDLYFVYGAETVIEAGGEGNDIVLADLSHTLAENVEGLQLVGTGAMDATGNALDNTLVGNLWSNRLDGATGADTLYGYGGDDIYVTDGSDTIIEQDGEGTDEVQSSTSHVLDAFVENLTLTGTAESNGEGNGLDNRVTGNASNNTLDGKAGADTLTGGAGNDTYIIDESDVIVELEGGGYDQVRTSFTTTLADNVDDLVLLAGAGAIDGTGNELDNIITGNESDNVLFGAGGADFLAGGAGNDTYILHTGDYAEEAVWDGDGFDTVQTDVTYVLGNYLEALVLSGTAVIDGTGNGLDNRLTGNSAANRLDGATGSDTLIGGDGDDVYVSDGGEVITELTGQGTDRVETSASHMLGDHIENLTLTGTGSVNATGNALDNVLTGNAGANMLVGGVGADTLIGGDGHDTYVITGRDTLIEAADGGTDTVRSAGSYRLGANFETLVLTGDWDINGTGNALNNRINGNIANNVLDGAGGADVLAGGQGDDTYLTDGGDVLTEAAGAGTDTVRSSASHTLRANLENLVLTGTAAINGSGNASDNVITGNDAANRLSGGLGADRLAGGQGRDILTGGSGVDHFVYAGLTDTGLALSTMDVIADFVAGEDKIDLSGLDAFAASATNDAFIWAGTGAFAHGTAGEVRVKQMDLAGATGDYTLVWIDTDGDAAAEMGIRLTGLVNLTAGDFLM